MPRAATAEEQRRAVEVAFKRSRLDLEELWLSYFTMGGDAGMVELEAYLHGLLPLSAGQRDILAHAVNERLDDLTTRLRVPYSRVVRLPPAPTGVLAALIGLLEGIKHAPPERIVDQLDAAGALLDVHVTIHLVDYGQSALIPLHADPTPTGTFTSGAPLPIESTLAGQAYQRVQIMAGDAAGHPHLWVPVLDGIERLGVLDVRLPDAEDPNDPQLRNECRWLADLLGHLISATTGFGDALDSARRLEPRTTSAELIWSLLPSLTAGTDRFMVAGQFEPSSSVGGDAFDYALSENHAQMAIFDATGHSLSSGLVAATALAAYRSVRRAGHGLFEQSMAIEEAVGAQFGDHGMYVTSVLAHLDLGSGRLRYINAGHMAPLVVRQGKVVKTLSAGRRPIFGIGPHPVSVGEEMLQPGDSLLLYTDGITEARDQDGQFFGIDRLSNFLQRATAAGYPAPETVRRLIRAVMAHQSGTLQDDATVLLSTWLSADSAAASGPDEWPRWY